MENWVMYKGQEKNPKDGQPVNYDNTPDFEGLWIRMFFIGRIRDL
jgi:hypothetical protein